MGNIRRAIFVIAAIWMSAMFANGARAFSEISTSAPYALLMDMETATILFERNIDTLMAPASMTKIITLALLFDALKAQEVRLDDKFLVSSNAVERGGERSGSSAMFLEPQSLVTVENLIRGVIVQSGNDAAITIAENLALNEEAFVEKMNLYARKIGMTKTTLKNSTGWPEEGHETTARDLAILTRHHIETYPEFYPYYAERAFTWNKITQANRNTLLRDRIGVDGLKTGHAQESGYGIAASAKRGKRRLILILNGLKSEQDRRGEGYKIINWGFRAFQTYRLFRAGSEIEKAVVWHGQRSRVPLTVAEDFSIAITREKRRLIRVSISYLTPISAPVKKDQQIGWVRVKELGGALIAERPLVASADVEELNFFGRAVSTLEYMLFGG